jgi:beta-1,4-N-acetylglucosaminyltransferase
MISALDFTRYTPRTYIISEGDVLSEKKAIALELSKGHEMSVVPVVRLPRGQECIIQEDA